MTLKRVLGNVALTASAAAALAAVWRPWGSWWQWLATAVVLLIVGAALAADADQKSGESR